MFIFFPYQMGSSTQISFPPSSPSPLPKSPPFTSLHLSSPQSHLPNMSAISSTLLSPANPTPSSIRPFNKALSVSLPNRPPPPPPPPLSPPPPPEPHTVFSVCSPAMGDMCMFWDGSANRVCVASLLQTRQVARLPGTVSGSCHCNGLKFSVDLGSFGCESATVLDCNCSICAKKGYLHLTVAKHCVTFQDENWKSKVTSYQFATGVAEHAFCKVCGVQAIYVPRSNPDCFSVNVRCLELDGRFIRIAKLDGKTFSGKLNVK